MSELLAEMAVDARARQHAWEEFARVLRGAGNENGAGIRERAAALMAEEATVYERAAAGDEACAELVTLFENIYGTGAEGLRRYRAGSIAVRDERGPHDLRTLQWGASPQHELDGQCFDMWTLTGPGEPTVTLGVPKGRDDIAAYVAAACRSPVRRVVDLGLGPHAVPDLDAGADALADVLFRATCDWGACQATTDAGEHKLNSWVINRALAVLWFAFCSSHPYPQRGMLLFDFLELATTRAQDPGPGPQNAGGPHAA